MVEALRWVASDNATMLLGWLLLVVTLLSLGPLHGIDQFVNRLPRIPSEPLRHFLIYYPDTIASRGVALPVLATVTLTLSWHVRSWRPVILAAGSVFTMICLVAAMKLVLARSHPRTGDPSFFGDFGGDWSFPSGHGANAILIYGVALFLIVRYRAVRPHIALRLGYAIVGIAMVQTAVSTYLHFHWLTDLLSGMLAGGFVLRATIRLDQLIPEKWTTSWWPFGEGHRLPALVDPRRSEWSAPPPDRFRPHGATPPVVASPPRVPVREPHHRGADPRLHPRDHHGSG